MPLERGGEAQGGRDPKQGLRYGVRPGLVGTRRAPGATRAPASPDVVPLGIEKKNRPSAALDAGAEARSPLVGSKTNC